MLRSRTVRDDRIPCESSLHPLLRFEIPASASQPGGRRILRTLLTFWLVTWLFSKRSSLSASFLFD